MLLLLYVTLALAAVSPEPQRLLAGTNLERESPGGTSCGLDAAVQPVSFLPKQYRVLAAKSPQIDCHMLLIQRRGSLPLGFRDRRPAPPECTLEQLSPACTAC